MKGIEVGNAGKERFGGKLPLKMAPTKGPLWCGKKGRGLEIVEYGKGSCVPPGKGKETPLKKGLALGNCPWKNPTQICS